MIDLSKVLLKFISETFKVAALKRIKPSVRKIFKEMQSLTELSKVLLEFVSETFSKYLLQSDGQFALWSFLYKPFYTIREIKHLREFPKVLLNLSVRPSPGSFKVLYESSKWPASFVEERNAKLLSEMRENHAKCVSVKKQPPEVFYKKSVLISLYSQESYVLESLFNKVSFLI